MVTIIKKDAQPLLKMREGYGVTGAQLNLSIVHLWCIKEWQEMAQKALETNDNYLAAQVLQNMMPFLNKFKDVEHPHSANIWETNDNEL